MTVADFRMHGQADPGTFGVGIRGVDHRRCRGNPPFHRPPGGSATCPPSCVLQSRAPTSSSSRCMTRCCGSSTRASTRAGRHARSSPVTSMRRGWRSAWAVRKASRRDERAIGSATRSTRRGHGPRQWWQRTPVGAPRTLTGSRSISATGLVSCGRSLNDQTCAACHGRDHQLSTAIREELRDRYPSDRATGFIEGEIRGWYWVEIPKRPAR